MDEVKREPGLEENFARLEALIGKMEQEDISLEEAFLTYSEGMAVLKQCNGQIDRVEKQVLKLSEEGRLEEFEDGSV
ncbi:MAG: exodeoxyribonuclease VII small subunit [Lachnospiraceae bacterium]|nr:exodeoxyribonuclease VII small subunit [Lachnospiraceae bacterium]